MAAQPGLEIVAYGAADQALPKLCVRCWTWKKPCEGLIVKQLSDKAAEKIIELNNVSELADKLVVISESEDKLVAVLGINKGASSSSGKSTTGGGGGGGGGGHGGNDGDDDDDGKGHGKDCGKKRSREGWFEKCVDIMPKLVDGEANEALQHAMLYTAKRWTALSLS